MDTLRQYSIAHTVNTWGRPKPEEQVAVAHAVGNFWQFAGKVLDKMRQDPDGAGLDAVRHPQAGASMPEVVTDSYLHSMMMAGIVAAHETTANATANAMKLLLQHPRVWREHLRRPGADPERGRGMPAPQRLGGGLAPAGDEGRAGRRRRHPGRLEAADRHLVGQPRRAPFRRRRPVRHPARQRQRPPDLRLRLAPVHGQEPGAHGDADLPGGVHAPPAAHAAGRADASATCPTPRFAGPSTCGSNGTRRRTRSAATLRVLRGAGAGAHRRAVAPCDHAAGGGRARHAGRRRHRSSCASSRPTARALPRWTPGSHIDVECGDAGPVAPVLAVRRPGRCGALEIAVLREPRRPRRLGLAACATRGPATGCRIRGPRNHFRLDESAPAWRLHRRRHRHHADRGDGASRAGARHRLRAALQRPQPRATMAFSMSSQALHGERLHVHASGRRRGATTCAALLATPRARTRRSMPAARCACSRRSQQALRALAAGCAAHRALRVDRRHAGPGARACLRGRAEGLGPASCRCVPTRRCSPALRAANIDVQSDCEEGLCGSCEVRVLAGEVDHRDVVLTRAEREAHTRMMSCCSRARGERLVLEL